MPYYPVQEYETKKYRARQKYMIKKVTKEGKAPPKIKHIMPN